MRYPSPEDYMKAVQRRESFTTDELRRAELVVHPLYQIPMPASGTSAVVFKADFGGEMQALRFFTREDSWSGDRYDALHEHFEASDLAGSVAMPRWVQDGILVNGRTWPVVRMQWVDGHTLNEHVEDLVRRQDTRALGTLAEEWLELVVRLQGAEFAHGDLQHGNVLVDPGGRMRLVDFDCSWIARFSGWPAPSETGHRNYQPPVRPWGRWMDTFSGLVIYTSLVALSKNPTPWHVLNTGENLLFRGEDYHPPFDTVTWTHLSAVGDRQVDDLARRLIECCVPGWAASGSLGDLVTPRAMPWWERTRFAAAGPGGPAGPGSPGVPRPGVAGPGPGGAWPAAGTPAAAVAAGSPAAGPHGRAGAAGAGPWPAGGAGTRPPSAARPRQPGANWWQDQPVRGGGAGRRSRTGPALAIALVLGVVVALLVVAAAGGDDDAIGGAVTAGLLAAVIAAIVGVAVARR